MEWKEELSLPMQAASTQLKVTSFTPQASSLSLICPSSGSGGASPAPPGLITPSSPSSPSSSPSSSSTSSPPPTSAPSSSSHPTNVEEGERETEAEGKGEGEVDEKGEVAESEIMKLWVPLLLFVWDNENDCLIDFVRVSLSVSALSIHSLFRFENYSLLFIFKS
tara:strand:+ start:687 stop:1181 length:495 start_codon:yes stop_codon:yes gene_type:complete